jgi:hypothetical protein
LATFIICCKTLNVPIKFPTLESDNVYVEFSLFSNQAWTLLNLKKIAKTKTTCLESTFQENAKTFKIVQVGIKNYLKKKESTKTSFFKRKNPSKLVKRKNQPTLVCIFKNLWLWKIVQWKFYKFVEEKIKKHKFREVLFLKSFFLKY